MRIIFHKNFEKRYKKLPEKIKKKVKERNIVFEANPFSPILNNHPLHGIYDGYRSIEVAGNIRMVYKLLATNVALFTEVGTHPQLYE